jgi:hypothetical protein
VHHVLLVCVGEGLRDPHHDRQYTRNRQQVG